MILDEQPDGLAAIAATLPRVNGRRINVSTLWRWIVKGVDGIHLEAVRLGGRYATSMAAIERFGRKLAENGVRGRGSRANRSTARKRRTPAQREREIARAKAELRKAGVK